MRDWAGLLVPAQLEAVTDVELRPLTLEPYCSGNSREPLRRIFPALKRVHVLKTAVNLAISFDFRVEDTGPGRMWERRKKWVREKIGKKENGKVDVPFEDF